MGKYKKKPVVIEAWQYPTEKPNEEEQRFFFDLIGFGQWDFDEGGVFVIKTLEGRMRVSPGDWIIKGVNGEFYPCKPGIFAQTYEVVN